MTMIRFLFASFFVLISAEQIWADATNREKQISPVPAIFVGGVGLSCLADGDIAKFLLLTKDRKQLGKAVFDNDDVRYDFFEQRKITPRSYSYQADDDKLNPIELDRQSLHLKYDQDYICELLSITDLHKAAKNHLRKLLSKNKI